MINLLQFGFPDYAIFSNYDCGYADLPKCLWLCVKVNIYRFSLNIIIKRQTSRYLVGYLPVKFTKSVTGELEEHEAKYIQRSKVC